MKYKVHNNNHFSVGIKLENPNRELNIRPKTSIMMEEEDIFYTDSVSKLFEKGILYVEEDEALEKMGYTEKNPNSISEAEIEEMLKLSNAKLKKEILQITERHAVAKVISVIKQGRVDLSQSKIKIINDALDIDVDLILKESEEDTIEK